MSEPITMLYIAGMVLGAKTALEGLQEGNLTKAIIGGVGAAIGASGLISGAAAGATAVGETVVPAATGMGAEMGGTAMTGFGDLTAGNFAVGAVNPAVASTAPAMSNLAAGSSLMEPAMSAGLANASFDTVLNQAPTQASLLDAPAANTNMNLLDAPVDGDMAIKPETMTIKSPNPKMEGGENIFQQGQQSLSNAWDSAKGIGTKLGEFAENNPYMASQLGGSAMQLLAGNQANNSAEELAEKKEAWEREQMLLSGTPANIYFDAQGVARDQYGKALDQQTQAG